MANDVIIPDLEGGPAEIFRSKNVETERLGDGIDGGMGFGIVGPNGKEFYASWKGKKGLLSTGQVDQNGDPEPSKCFDFVILRKAARKSHTYYKDLYQRGRDGRPDCASTDGIAPDDVIGPYDPETKKGKQADLCELCEHYAWKRQPNGRDGRACTDSLRLAVFPADAMVNRALGTTLVEPILFRIMAASLRGFSQLGDDMEAKYGGNSPFCSYVTRVSFKKDVQWPQYEYRVLRWLKPKEAEMILELREHPVAYRILGLTPEGRSLVRRAANGTLGGQAITHAQVPLIEPGPRPAQDDLAEKLANERQARIAAVRTPQTIEATAEEIVPPKPEPPADQQAPQVVEAPMDLDELVRAMRPQPPR
jgi:hypothetical protein